VQRFWDIALRRELIAGMRVVWLALALLLFAGSAARASIDLPEIAASAARYRQSVIGAGDGGQSLAASLLVAKEASEQRRWMAAIGALKQILARNPDDPDTWLQLARTWRRQDPRAQELADSAYNAYLSAHRAGLPEDGPATEALLLIAQQLELMKRRDLAIRTYAEIGRIVSDNTLAHRLGDNGGGRGFKVIETQDDEPDPSVTPVPVPVVRADARAPSWCAVFTAPLREADPAAYRDPVRVYRNRGGLRDPLPVELRTEGSTLCLFGFSHGESYQISLLPGFAAADGRTLDEQRDYAITIPDRKSDLGFKSDTLVLPMSGDGKVSLRTVNIINQPVTLLLLHVTDRQLINEIALGHVRSGLTMRQLNDLAKGTGRIIWHGTVAPVGKRNEEAVSALPIGAILNSRKDWTPGSTGDYTAGFVDDGGESKVGPGVYALVAFPGDCLTGRNPRSLAAEQSGFSVCLKDDKAKPASGASNREGNDDAAATAQDQVRVATQWIVWSDLGVQLLRGPGGLRVVARSLSEGTAKRAVHVQLVSTANHVLGEADTGPDGWCDFPARLADGILGNQLRGVFAYSGGDFVFLDTSLDTLDLSDRGVAGRPAPGNLDAYVWTARGIYRPGESVRAMIMVRDRQANAVAPPPLQLRLTQPDGTVFGSRWPLPERLSGGVAAVDVKLPGRAMPGEWKLEAMAGDATIGATAIEVMAFVPNRIDLTVSDIGNAVLQPGKSLPVTITATYRYGAAAAGLSGLWQISLRRASDPFPGNQQLQAFQFGVEGNDTPEVQARRALPRTDAQGNAAVDITIDKPANIKAPLEALLRLQVNDTDGSSVGREIPLKVNRAGQQWIGARQAEPSPDGAARIDLVVAAGETGERVARRNLHWRLFAEEEAFQWERLSDSDNFRYDVRRDLRLVTTGTIDVAGTGAPDQIVLPQPLGRYQIEITSDDGMATRLSFTHGFEGGRRMPGRPDLVTVTLDKPSYAAGDTMRVKVQPRFAGELMLAIAGDRIYWMRNLTADTAGVEVPVRVAAEWGPHPYVLATVFRKAQPAGATGPPGPPRAIGAAGFTVQRPEAVLSVDMSGVPNAAPPSEPLHVTLKVGGLRRNATGYVVLAAVDEGVLSLTPAKPVPGDPQIGDFKSPSPNDYFFGPRRLAVELLDNYGRLISGEGNAVQLRSGGDNLGPLRGSDYHWSEVFAWQSEITRLDANGEAALDIPVPEFLGRARLMAVAWSDDQAGYADKKVTVNLPVVLRADRPRVLAAGDVANLDVAAENLSAPDGDFDLSAEVRSGPVRIEGEKTRRIHLGKGFRTPGRERLPVKVTALTPTAADYAEKAVIGVTLRGVTDTTFETSLDLEVLVRPATEPVSRLSRIAIAPQQPALVLTRDELRKRAGGLDPATVWVRQRVTAAPQIGVGLGRDDLASQPLSAASLAGHAALLTAAIAEAGGWDHVGDQLHGPFERTQVELVALQRPDGSFRAYPGQPDLPADKAGASEHDKEAAKAALEETRRLTAYIGDVLASAREQALPVVGRAIGAAGDFLMRSTDQPQCTGDEAYAVFVLVRLQRAPYGIVEGLRNACAAAADSTDQPPDLTGRLFAAAALNLFGLDNDGTEANRIAVTFQSAGDKPPADLAAMLYGFSETHLGAASLQQIFAAAAAKVGDRSAAVGLEARGTLALAALRGLPQIAPDIVLRVAGQVQHLRRGTWQSPEIRLADLDHTAAIENLSERPLTQEVILRGVPVAAQPAAADGGVVLARRVYRLKDGLDPTQPIDPAKTVFERNELLIVVIEGKTGDVTDLGDLHAFLPAGWVIEAADLKPELGIAPEARALLRLDPPDNPTSTAVLRREARADSLYAVLDLNRAQRGFRLGFLARAAFPGQYLWPGVSLTGQYDASIAGRAPPARVTVTGE